MRVEWFLVAAVAHGFRTLDVQVHDYRILSASDYHGLARHIGPGVDFLMRDVGRNVDEISGIGLFAEFQMIAPADARATSDHVNDRLQFAVMMRARPGVRLNDYRTSP